MLRHSNRQSDRDRVGIGSVEVDSLRLITHGLAGLLSNKIEKARHWRIVCSSVRGELLQCYALVNILAVLCPVFIARIVCLNVVKNNTSVQPALLACFAVALCCQRLYCQSKGAWSRNKFSMTAYLFTSSHSFIYIVVYFAVPRTPP
nr:unnamed protein product [Spirometra erinaceieuropaei]